MSSTIITGLIIFLLGQLILEFILKPIKEYKDVKHEVFNKLKYYSNIITNPSNLDDFISKNGPGYEIILDENKQEFNKLNKLRAFEKYLKVSDEIRKLSCDLENKYYYNFDFVRNLFITEKYNDVECAASCLIRISNSLFDRDKNNENNKDIDLIKKYLRISAR